MLLANGENPFEGLFFFVRNTFRHGVLVKARTFRMNLRQLTQQGYHIFCPLLARSDSSSGSVLGVVSYYREYTGSRSFPELRTGKQLRRRFYTRLSSPPQLSTSELVVARCAGNALPYQLWTLKLFESTLALRRCGGLNYVSIFADNRWSCPIKPHPSPTTLKVLARTRA